MKALQVFERTVYDLTPEEVELLKASREDVKVIKSVSRKLDAARQERNTYKQKVDELTKEVQRLKKFERQQQSVDCYKNEVVRLRKDKDKITDSLRTLFAEFLPEFQSEKGE
jgi:uncharacterized coiled-coil DUF342 family protein